jgi:phosphate transport system substrate-binding protein
MKIINNKYSGGIKMKSKRVLGIIMVIMIMTFAFTACARPTDDNQNGAAPGEKEQNISINGSTSVQPLAEELAQAFKGKNPNITIDIQGGGSGVGIKSANDGVVDIGMSSRELKTEEKNLKEFKIAIDGIAVIVNPANGVTNLTMEQIQKIYTGEISDWSQVGGKAGKITIVTREEGSGTRGAFIELTGVEVKDGDKKVDKTSAAAITQGSTGSVMTTVASDPNAIGYASYGAVKENTDIKLISVEGVETTAENIYAGSYKISRPFLMLAKEEPAGAIKEFIDFILGAEGQEIVESHNYLKVNK